MTAATVQKIGFGGGVLLYTTAAFAASVFLWFWGPTTLPSGSLAVIFFLGGVTLGISGYRRYLAKSIDSVVTQLEHIAGNDDFGQVVQDRSGELTDIIRPLNQCLLDLNRDHENTLRDMHTLAGRNKIIELQYMQSLAILDCTSDGGGAGVRDLAHGRRASRSRGWSSAWRSVRFVQLTQASPSGLLDRDCLQHNFFQRRFPIEFHARHRIDHVHPLDHAGENREPTVLIVQVFRVVRQAEEKL